MKKSLLKMFGGIMLTILALAIAAQIFWVSAQEDNSVEQEQRQTQQDDKQEDSLAWKSRNARALEGVWNNQVTLRNCQTGAEIRTIVGMNTFARGGTTQETGVGTAPSLRSPGHGVWSYQFGRRFFSVLQFFRFNPDGTYAGTQKVRKQIELSRFGSNFTATVAVEIFDANGNLVGTGCATETAARFE